MKEEVRQGGNKNFIHILTGVLLLIGLIGSIFSYVPFQSDKDLVEEHSLLYSKITSETNTNELALFKEYKSQLPVDYVKKLITIKKNNNQQINLYKKEKQRLINEQSFYGFNHKKAFWQYTGMYLALIGLSISGFIVQYVKDKNAKLIFNFIYTSGIAIGCFFIHYSLYDDLDLPDNYHYAAASIYIIISLFTLRSLHVYLINFNFYSASIKKLNNLLFVHSIKYINEDKKQEYITETVKKVEETLYPEI